MEMTIPVEVRGVAYQAEVSYESNEVSNWYFTSIYNAVNDDVYPELSNHEVAEIDRQVSDAMNEYVGTRGVDSMDAVHARIEDDMIGEMIDAMNESLDGVLA